VDELLGEVLEQTGTRVQVERMAVLDAWPEIVGEKLAAVARADAVDGPALVVRVKNSPWLMELNMMRGELLERVNAHMDGAPLERIVFVLAETG
jgi:predicted nucleic acid-binding Zn ribbon protein